MAEPFLEERLPISIKMGATYADEYSVEITRTSSGKEYRRLIQPYPVRYYNIGYIAETPALWNNILGLYHRCYGMYAGFRVHAIDDFSTNSNVGAPTPYDQPLSVVSPGVVQLQKQYGEGGTALPIGLPKRTIFKPVSGTVRVALGANEILPPYWSVDTKTGLITFLGQVITGISKAAQAEITLGAHSFKPNQPVYISGVNGMTEINNRMATVTAVTATTIKVNIDSTSFSYYSYGGAVRLDPQAGGLTGGCQFDIPFRFNSRIDVAHASAHLRETSDIEIVELIAL